MGNLPKKRILVVDDEKDAGLALESILKRAGYLTKSVLSGVDAIECVKKSNFDLMFLDIYLPKMGGLEIFRQIKKIQPELKVCLMTGWPKGVDYHREEYINLIREGAIDKILRKAFGREQVLRVVQEIFSESAENKG